MSWTSLEGGDTTSNSDEQDAEEQSEEPMKISSGEVSSPEEKGLLLSNSCSSASAEGNSYPVIQEPNSEHEWTLCKKPSNRAYFLLASKDEHINSLQKLLNSQREQLYHFFNVSGKTEQFLHLKNSCRDEDAFEDNENLSMALDKFRKDNNVPTEQTLLREDVFRTLMKLERLMKHQEKVVKTMEHDQKKGGDEEISEDKEIRSINCYRYDTCDTYIHRLLFGTKEIGRMLESLRLQLKRIGLIEEERIHLIERVYSLPADERRYYAQLIIIEREKMRLQAEIQRLNESCENLKQNCQTLQQTKETLEGCIERKMADFDLKQIKPGLETHVELMEMVERGELSLIALTKDEKGKFTDEFNKLRSENEDLMKRLKDFDVAIQERDDLRKQVRVLVDSCSQLEKEVKLLRLSSKTDALLAQLREACVEREQLKVQLNRITKEGPGVMRICGETVSKITEERDELRLKLAEYVRMEDDINSLKFKASQAECYRIEADRLKQVVSELEEVKAAYMAHLDKNSKNPTSVSPLDRDMYRNMFKELTHLKDIETQKERLSNDILKYKSALLKQEQEIKDLIVMVDHLMEQFKGVRIKPGAIPLEGAPEGPEVTRILLPEDEKRLEAIRNRVRTVEKKPLKLAMQEEQPKNTGSKNALMSTLKSFLGFDWNKWKTDE